jgi:uncharacterized protein (TIGR03437 family)
MFRTLLLFCAVAPLVLAQPIAFVSGDTIDSHNSRACAACIVAADFNGDGKPDIAIDSIVFVDYNGVALGNGDGTFRPILPFAHALNGVSISTGDFNGDGRPDLLFRGEGFSYSPSDIEFGEGDGTFSSPIQILACSGSGSRDSNSVIGPVADFNRDGKSDLLCGMTPLLSNGDGTFRAVATVGNQAMETPVLVTDLNGDGIPDIVIRQISGQITVALGEGDGTFGSEILSNYAQSPQRYPAVLAGDFNGDGKVDLVTFSLHGNYAGDAIELLPGKGDGTFGAVIRTDLSASPASGDVTLAADFNHDDKLDLVGQNAVYAGNGDGTFRFPVLLPGASAAAGNFNGDSMPDIVELDSTQDGESIRLLVNDSPGDGFWTPGVSSATGTWPIAGGSFVSAYGVNLAPKTETADANPLPTTLGGIRVHLNGNITPGDHLAPLLYVSPTQINYLLDSSDPITTVSIERVGSPVQHAAIVDAVSIAPGFFDVKYSATAGGYLTLYGTGFARATTSASSCYVGTNAVPATVTYAGPQMQIDGLAQVNMLLPASLAGAGVQPVTCVFGDQDGDAGTSKAIQVTIQ